MFISTSVFQNRSWEQFCFILFFGGGWFLLFALLTILRNVYMGLSNYSQAGPPVLASRVVLEHSHTLSFTCFLWLLSGYNGRLEKLQQRIMLHQA